ncbi:MULTISPECIES: hypothetical protein [Nocardiopsis]|uniref:hypothetical protein n=1 Tax=Nocardiopsis TaxID=2013 RepID=UPI00034B3F4A|nr:MULTISPECIES: hypothetical protein [Nocardiopsis]MBQ1083282.1 hypothetical protein [Nocardiopsis sp. B62]PWV50274.1 hypothetical protein BDW27_108313 [Nocardiopsis sp. L17-MgMaSL7]
MISDVIDWFKGLFGDTAEQVTDGVSQTLDQVGGGAEEAVGTFQETGQDLVGQDYGQVAEDALGGVTEGVTDNVTESVQGFQEQAETIGGIAEDPMGAAVDEARDRFGQG